MELSKALVVDDSRSARFSLRKTLEKLGIHTDCVDCGENALSYLSESGNQLPDIIFMDNLMPGLNGYDTSKAILNEAKWTQIPIVMCSATETQESLPKVLDHGMQGLLPKPASLNDVSTLLTSIQQQNQAHTSDSAATEENESSVLNQSDKMFNTIFPDEWKTFQLEIQEQFNRKIAVLKRQVKEQAKQVLIDELNNRHLPAPSHQVDDHGASLESSPPQTKMFTESDLLDQVHTELKTRFYSDIEKIKQQLQQQMQDALRSKSVSEKEILEESKKQASFIATHQAIETSQRVYQEAAQKMIDAALKEHIENSQTLIQNNNIQHLKRILRRYKVFNVAISIAAMISLVLHFV